MVWCDGEASESVLARYFDPKLGRFLTQDSFLGQIDEPPSLHRYLYAGNRPTFYVDPLGHAWITANDLKNAGKAFAGVVYGAGEAIAAVGVLSYQVTGTVLYGAGLSSYHEKTAREFWGGIDALSAKVSEQGLGQTALDVVTAPVERIKRGIEAGDAFEAGAGVGNLTVEAAVLAEGAAGLPRVSVSVTPARAVAYAGTGSQTVVPGGLSIAVAGGSGGSAAVPGFLMSQANKEISGTQGEQGNYGPGEGPRDPLPADKSLAKQKQLQANKKAGDAWEGELINSELPKTQHDIRPQITVKSRGPSGKKTRLDALGTDEAGAVRLTEGKASAEARLTPNQKVVHPELEVHGGTVVGEGKAPYVGGIEIPPTKVEVRRKP